MKKNYRKSGNMTTGDLRLSPFDAAVGRDPETVVHPALEKLRQIGIRKRQERDLSNASPATSRKLESVAKRNPIAKTSRNPFK